MVLLELLLLEGSLGLLRNVDSNLGEALVVALIKCMPRKNKSSQITYSFSDFSISIYFLYKLCLLLFFYILDPL